MVDNKTRKNRSRFSIHQILKHNSNIDNNNIVYSEDDYNSNDGMLTTVWGPSMWHYLHTMSFNYPVHPTDADKNHYRDFILNLEHVLPCGKCRKTYIRISKTTFRDETYGITCDIL